MGARATTLGMRTKKELRQLVDDTVSDEELLKMLRKVALGEIQIVKKKPHSTGIKEMEIEEVITPTIAEQLKAAEMIFDRKHGRPDAHLSVDGDSSNGFDYSTLSFEELQFFDRIARRQLPETIEAQTEAQTGVKKP